MRNALRSGIAFATLCFAGSVFAACPDDINKLRTDLQGNKTFQERYTAGKVDRASFMRLFDAAQTFANQGMDRRCQDVLAGIRELSEKAEAEAPAQPRAEQPPRADQPRTAPPPAGPRTTERTPPRTDERVERLRAGQAINAVSVSMETLVGSDVRNLSNTDLGDVTDVVSERGQITGIVIGRGGFLGMGVSHHLIQANQAKVANLDSDRRDAKHWVVVLDLSEDQVKALPRVKKEAGRWVADSDDQRTPPRATPSAPPSTEPRQRQ